MKLINRLYPTIPRLERITKQTVEINGITIPKDMLVMVPVYALHRDPEFWPEPEEFKPERWATEGGTDKDAKPKELRKHFFGALHLKAVPSPHRFSKLNKHNINPYTYLPFGIGPRNCLGMRFAQVIVKVALVDVLRKYSFEVCEETEVIFQMSDTTNNLCW